MSNSAPWVGQSLGGVSVIPTPLKSPTCKGKKKKEHTSAQTHCQTEPADTLRDCSVGGGIQWPGLLCVGIHKLLPTVTAVFYLHL